MTNQKFNKLTVIKFDHYDKKYNSYWLCKCECGNYKQLEEVIFYTEMFNLADVLSLKDAELIKMAGERMDYGIKILDFVKYGIV